MAAVAAANKTDENTSMTVAVISLTETNLAEMMSAVISGFEKVNADSEMNMANHELDMASRTLDLKRLIAGLLTASEWMGVMRKPTARTANLKK